MKAGNAGRDVLWNFARLMRGPPRAIPPEEIAADTPPERFVAKIADEGGDVYIAPVVEALRAALKAKRAPASDPSTDAPEPAIPVEPTEARP